MDLASTDAGAGEGDRVTLGPVLAAGVDRRFGFRPNSPAQTTRVSSRSPRESRSSSESGEPSIGGGHQSVLELVEVVAVGVPEVAVIVVPIDRHEADTRLHQPAGQEQTLAVDVPAVAVAESEGLRGRAGTRLGPRQTSGSPLPSLEGGPRHRRTPRHGRWCASSESKLRRLANRSGETPSGKSQTGDGESGIVRVAFDREWVERLTEPTRRADQVPGLRVRPDGRRSTASSRLSGSHPATAGTL